MKTSLIALVLVSASLVAACSSSDSTSSSSSSSSSGSSGGADAAPTPEADAAVPATINVSVQSNKFVPASLTIKVGDTVTWTWAGGSHDVVSGANCTSDGAYSSDLESEIGKTFTHTYDKAGTFEYFCTPHCISAGMKATIIVQ